jgi:DNA polymerase-4
MTRAVETPRRTVAHVDMDTFYVSVERLLDPTLNGKPVAVGGTPDGRGVVASASYEARKFGVRAAMPMSQAIRLCPQLVVVQGTYSRYSEFSAKARAAFSRFTPQVQMASQDEAYLELTGTERLWGSPLQMAESIRRAVAEETRLPCSVGIGANKLVAKVASSHSKPRGLLWVPHGSEAAFLAPLPVGDIPGIGPRAVERLNSVGIRTVAQLARLDDEAAAAMSGSAGREMRDRARGISRSPVAADAAPKSIGAEETFDSDTTDADFLGGMIANLAEKVAYRLRREGFRAATLTVKYRYSDFETHTAAITLPAPTDDEVAIMQAARRLLEEKRHPRRALRLVGVTASNLLSKGGQLDLLDQENDAKRTRLHAAIDALRAKHGYDAVRRAASTGRHEEKNEKQWG